MEQDASWKADSSSDGQEIADILRNRKSHFPCEVSGFRREDDSRALLGCYSATSGEFLPTFRDDLLVPSSKGQESKMLTPEDGTGRLSRNVRNYHYWLCNDPEEFSSCSLPNSQQHVKCPCIYPGECSLHLLIYFFKMLFNIIL